MTALNFSGCSTKQKCEQFSRNTSPEPSVPRASARAMYGGVARVFLPEHIQDGDADAGKTGREVFVTILL